MRKKLASISLIVTVNILLLTFLAVAHHHHEGIPHFTWNERETEQESTGSNSCCHSNEKDESCRFEQNYIALKPYRKQSLSPSHFRWNHPDNHFQIPLSAYTFDFSLPNTREPFRRPPYLAAYHSVIAHSGRGLRAPPRA
ncbi:MAG: hypothetical protein LBP83_09515 [Dysgonamonadaceae bacterium]|jgi:hypothetical protein|nr:hypothetical protein [Dysgonamonadaceae bacterium]